MAEGTCRPGSFGERAIAAPQGEPRLWGVERDAEAAEAPAESAVEIDEAEMEPCRHAHLDALDGERPGIGGGRRVACVRPGDYHITVHAASSVRSQAHCRLQEPRSEEHTSELQSLMRNSYA